MMFSVYVYNCGSTLQHAVVSCMLVLALSLTCIMRQHASWPHTDTICPRPVLTHHVIQHHGASSNGYVPATSPRQPTLCVKAGADRPCPYSTMPSCNSWLEAAASRQQPATMRSITATDLTLVGTSAKTHCVMSVLQSPLLQCMLPSFLKRKAQSVTSCSCTLPDEMWYAVSTEADSAIHISQTVTMPCASMSQNSSLVEGMPWKGLTKISISCTSL